MLRPEQIQLPRQGRKTPVTNFKPLMITSTHKRSPTGRSNRDAVLIKKAVHIGSPGSRFIPMREARTRRLTLPMPRNLTRLLQQ